MPTDKIGLGYTRENKKYYIIEMVELEPENIEYEELIQGFERMTNQSEIESDISIPEYIFYNMVQIEEIYDKV